MTSIKYKRTRTKAGNTSPVKVLETELEKLRQDLRATVRSLIIANDYLTRELEYAWQLVSPGFSRQTRTRRKSTGSD